MTGFRVAPDELVIHGANSAGAKDGEMPGGYDALVNWSRSCGLLSDAEADVLTLRASNDRDTARLVRARSIELQGTLFELFSAVALRRKLPAEPLTRMERFVHEGAQRRHLEQSDEDAGCVWRIDRSELDAMLWPLVEAATNLLTSNRIARVKMCSGEGCSRLFIDNSQKRNRRWCDMRVCGNRAKARRHFERAKNVKPVEAKAGSAKVQTVPVKPKARDDGAFVWMS